MESVDDLDTPTLLRRTIRQLVDSPDHELELASLVAVISADDGLRLVAEQELAPWNAHLELHLGGHKVVNHSTVAKSFGQFISQMADSVKVTVRDISGVDRLGDELLIEAGPGSVKTTFIAPLRANEGTTLSRAESLDEILADDDSYSEALRRLTTVLANADPDSPDAPALDAAIGLIPAASRSRLRKALDEAHKQSWSLEGSFSQRGLGITRVNVRPSAITFLRERLTETVVIHDTLESSGYLDGHVWSTGIMRFIPSGEGRPIVASFGNSRVHLEVGMLDSKPSQKVKVKLRVIVTSGLASKRTSYILESIEAIPLDITPNLFGDDVPGP